MPLDSLTDESHLTTPGLSSRISSVESLLTVKEVAEFLRVPASWVYGRARRRSVERLPHFKVGKYIRFRQSDLEAYVQTLPHSRVRYAARRAEVEAYLTRAVLPAKAEQHVLEKSTVKKEKPEQTVTVPWEPAEPKVESRPRPTMPETQVLGRGGPQHKYLQELIKRWAESKGYRTTIEEQFLDGLGSVDVSLEKEGRAIACEISVSTTVEHEVGNVQKCLAAGFEHVALICSERKILAKSREAIAAAVGEADRARVQILMPEEFFAFVETLEAGAASREETVHGYKVKVQYQPVDEEEKKAKKQAISQVIMKAVRRLKGDKR